jgi:hypothetical protein
MKLKWSEMKEPTFIAFRMFKKYPRSGFILGVQPIYDCLRTTAPVRAPESGPATQAFETSKANWDKDAIDFAEPKIRISFRGLP